MYLDNLLITLQDSRAADWDRLPIDNIYTWEVAKYFDSNLQEHSYIVPNCHGCYALYRFDVDLSLAWGAAVKDDARAPWMKWFDAPKATVIQLRYRGNPTCVWRAAMVENGKFLIPEPQSFDGKNLMIDEEALRLARLLFEIHAPSDPPKSLDEFFAERGIHVSNHAAHAAGR